MGIFSGIGNILGSIGSDITGAVSSIGNDIGGAVSGGVQSAENVGSDLLNGNIGGAIGDAVQGVGNFFSNLFGGGSSGLQPAAPFSPPSGGTSGSPAIGLGLEQPPIQLGDTQVAGGGGGSGGGVDSSGSAGGAGGVGGFDGDFNDLANGADPSNANSILGIQTQADQEQTMLELAAKLESMQSQTDQFISQNL
jgi:hypothetical protein